MPKKNIKLSLLFMDLIVLLTIFVSVYFLFEFVINKILKNYSIDKFYESMRTSQFDLTNSIAYIEEKKELDYKKFTGEIFNYIKLSTLKRSKYDNSIFAVVFPDEENYIVAGKKSDPDYKIATDDRDFNYLNLKDKIEENTRLNNPGIEFSLQGKNYVGIAKFAEIGIRKSFDRYNNELIKPILIIADNKNDFYYLLNRVRNIFFILLSIVFGLGAIFKIYNTNVITREIYDIRDRMAEASDDLREKGLISKDDKILKKKFIETTSLDSSFSNLTISLLDLGEIISGIADRDLFIATLKKDNTLLIPHDEMMTVMFLDIQGFTSITEAHKNDIMQIINRIWTEAGNIIGKNKGKINKLIGDAALIIFLDNHKDGQTNSSLNAFYSAVELLERVPLIARDINISFNFRVGLDYGKVTYGKTGTDKNYELGVIGDPVNTASRLEALSKQYHTNLLITENVFINLGLKINEEYDINSQIGKETDFPIRLFRVDKARPKGKKEAKEIYTVIKNKDNKFGLIGNEKYFDPVCLENYQKILDYFLDSFQSWRDYLEKKQADNEFNLSEETLASRNAAEKKWSVLAKTIGKFYLDSGFPPVENFLKIILKYEEYEEFKKIPQDWLKKEFYKVKEPYKDWIELGSIELDK